MRKVVACLFLICLSSAGQAPARRSPDQEKVWDLEQAYWKYAKGMELDKYLTLWHASVAGWPIPYSAPLGKDHISDWLTGAANKGLTMKSYELEPLAIKITDNVAVTHYRVKYTWIDQEGRATPVATRITHTWIKSRDRWQIIGGMSALVNAQGQ